MPTSSSSSSLCSLALSRFSFRYDRTTLLRARRVLGNRARIDHHADCGFVSSSPVANYMELFPFIDRLWCVCLIICQSPPYPLRSVLRVA